MAPFIQFKNISFSYDSVPVLHNFSFTAAKGEKGAIKGESGSGTITFNGREVFEDNFESVRKNATWLPQDLNIGSGTVEEVILRPFEFGLNRSARPNPDRIINAFSALGLDGSVLESPFRELSTGQRQRVGLALCYLLDRPLLLLDEPTSALDQTSKRKTIELLFSDRDRTVISTTHDPYWLEQCDRICSLD